MIIVYSCSTNRQIFRSVQSTIMAETLRWSGRDTFLKAAEWSRWKNEYQALGVRQSAKCFLRYN